jgi:hypothetical protein
MDELRDFKCDNGHVLGIVHKSGRGLRSLLLYRYAINYGADQGIIPDVDVLAIVDSAIEIRCSVCESKRAWVPGEDELERIVSRQQRHRAEREVNNCSIIREEVSV